MSFLGPPPDREVQADDYPVLVQSPGGNQVLVAQAYRMSKYLGQLDITFDDDGRVETWSGNPVLLDSSIQQGELLDTFKSGWTIWGRPVLDLQGWG